MSNNKKEFTKIPLIINCDTGIDDAVALMLAVKCEKFDIKLITTDVGNIQTKQAARNSLNILELIGAENIPVVAGEGKCLETERPRPSVHGGTGMGDYVFEDNSRRIMRGDAVEKMYETLMASEIKTTILCMSPPTNVAKLLQNHPDCKNKIQRVVFMAGSIEEVAKNAMPYPEFNVSCDPEAGEVLLKSKVPLEIVPMEMGHTAYLTYQEVFKTKLTNHVGAVLEVIFRSYKDRHVKNGIATHDGCAVAYLSNPELFKVQDVNASVKYFEKINSGVLMMNFSKKPNAKTCVSMDIKAFKKLYFNCLKKCK